MKRSTVNSKPFGFPGSPGFPKCLTNGESEMENKEKTLRDEFAMSAISGLCVSGSHCPEVILAKLAYNVADAMMKERSK